MCEGSAAQLLCVLEALGEPGRRTLRPAHAAHAAQDPDPDMQDVTAELFMAAQEILAGACRARIGCAERTSEFGGVLSCKQCLLWFVQGSRGVRVCASRMPR